MDQSDYRRPTARTHDVESRPTARAHMCTNCREAAGRRVYTRGHRHCRSAVSPLRCSTPNEEAAGRRFYRLRTQPL